MPLSSLSRRGAIRALGATVFAAVTAGRGGATSPHSPMQTDSERIDPLGFVPLTGARDAVTDGDLAYVAVNDGLAIVDVSDPNEPELLAERRAILDEREGGPLREVWDVQADGDRVVVVGPAHRLQDAINAAVVFDASDPADPEPVAVHETAFPIHNCYLDAGYLYLTGNDGAGNPLVIVDVSASPEEVGRWSILEEEPEWETVDSRLRVLHDVWVRDGLAYLPQWNAGTWIVDVTDPSKPAYVSRIEGVDREYLAELEGEEINAAYTSLPGNDHYVTTNEDGTLLALGREAWATERYPEGGPGGVELWDLADLSEPELLSTIEAPETPDASYGGVWTTAHNCDLVGDRLYTSWYRGGVRIHDVSDPAEPVERARWEEREEASFWTAKVGVPGEFFVASSTDAITDGLRSGLYVFPDPTGDGRTDFDDDRTDPGDDRTDLDDERTDPGEDSVPPDGADDTSTDGPDGIAEDQEDGPEDETVEGDRSNDDENGPGQPGFGTVAAITAIATALGARLIRSLRDEETER